MNMLLLVAAVFSIADFGADAAKSPRENAAAIQRAIDSAASNTPARVVVPKGVFRSGTVWLKSGVELYLEKDAVLKASDQLEDYNALDAYPQNYGIPEEYWNGAHFIICHEQHDVAITGKGTIDGSSEAFLEAKPQAHYEWMQEGATCWWNGIRWAKDKKRGRPGQLVAFVESGNCRVEGITIRNAPSWCLFFHGCTDVVVRDYTVRCGHDDGNSDGVDIDCCERVLLEKLDIDTGDDCVAIRADVEKLKTARPCRNVTVRDCVFGSTSSMCRVGVGRGFIENVLFERCRAVRGRIGFTIRGSHGWPREGVDVSKVVARDCDFSIHREAYTVMTGGEYEKYGIRGIRFERCKFRPEAARNVGSENSPFKPEVSEIE